MYFKISTCTKRPTEKMSKGLERHFSKENRKIATTYTETSSHTQHEGSKWKLQNKLASTRVSIKYPNKRWRCCNVVVGSNACTRLCLCRIQRTTGALLDHSPRYSFETGSPTKPGPRLEAKSPSCPLSPPTQPWRYSHARRHLALHVDAGIHTWVLMLAQQTLFLLSHSSHWGQKYKIVWRSQKNIRQFKR